MSTSLPQSLSPVLQCFTPELHKVSLNWFVHFLKLTAVTQSTAQTKAKDRNVVCAKDISPAVKGIIHGPVEEMFIRDE